MPVKRWQPLAASLGRAIQQPLSQLAILLSQLANLILSLASPLARLLALYQYHAIQERLLHAIQVASRLLRVAEFAPPAAMSAAKVFADVAAAPTLFLENYAKKLAGLAT